MKVRIDYKNALSAISKEEVKNFEATVLKAKETLVTKSGAGNDFLGWVEYPINYDKCEFARIKAAAEKIQKDSDVLVVIGIGGSYLGAKAIIEALNPYFRCEKERNKSRGRTLYARYASGYRGREIPRGNY